jgi:hypothetical protein
MSDCLECGKPHALSGLFCGDPCRTRFNNRRKSRGLILYDLFMAVRYERTLASKLGAWRAMCRLAAQYRVEDQATRAGRKSWRAIPLVLSENPWLLSNVDDRFSRKAATKPARTRAATNWQARP